MRRIACIVLLLPALLGSVTPCAEPEAGEEAARSAAHIFGQALKAADASLLRPILPQQGKVELRLARLAPEEGYFSAGQVEALMRDFLKQGSVRSFDLVHLEHQTGCLALVHARWLGTDREGRPARVEMRLGFQPEGTTWVLREIRETPP